MIRLRHFDAKLVVWEEKDQPISLPLVAWKEGEAAFGGLTACARARSASPTGG